MKIFALALITILTIHSAPGGSGGSAYSIFGIGDLRYGPGAASAAMGYTGIGIPSRASINPLSPATWSRIDRTRLDAGMLYEGFNSSDGTRSLYRANGDFNGGLLALPISPDNGITFVGGFMPYSNVTYSMFTGGSQQAIDYTVNHTGRGGLGNGIIGLSYAPSPGLSFGASMRYLFGTIEHSRLLNTTSTSSVGISGGTTTESISMKGIVTTMGGMYSGFGSIAEGLKHLSLGVVLSSRSRLNSTRQYIYTSAAETDSTDEAKGSFIIPVAFGVGLSYQAGERFLLASDYYTQMWGKAEFNGLRPDDLRNSFRWGIGGERIPNRDMTAPWLDRLALRLGFYYHATYYRVNNEPINEWGLTGGFGFPFGGDSRLNLALEYGKRGTVRNSLIQDTIIRATLSVSLSEAWFVRFEEE